MRPPGPLANRWGRWGQGGQPPPAVTPGRGRSWSCPRLAPHLSDRAADHRTLWLEQEDGGEAMPGRFSLPAVGFVPDSPAEPHLEPEVMAALMVPSKDVTAGHRWRQSRAEEGSRGVGGVAG